MRSQGHITRRIAPWALLWSLLICVIPSIRAQTGPNQRTFPQSKATVEKALRAMQSNLGGHLPALEGFAQPGDHPLDRYQRGYYQTTVQVNPSPSGGSLVRISTKVTAWYNDPAGHSGYQLLISNGRLEADLLDQLAEELARTEGGQRTAPAAPPTQPSERQAAPEPAISAPVPRFPATVGTFSSSLSQGLVGPEGVSGSTPAPNAEKTANLLQAEVDSLAEILKNQGHPKNLVAVKKSGTPVVATPSLNAKPLFLASMHDEFEMLNFDRDWVHVRISGLSRGWIWRNGVEMPEGIPDTDAPVVPALAPAADLFHVIREETAPFPGDWEPLRGKSVKIISVQKIDDNVKDGGPKERLEYAKFLLDKSFAEMAQKPQEMAGIVVIFDSADGGMIAATSSALAQWKAGSLSDSALWHKCFFDPPETFDSTGPSGNW
jgi:hypothetical protein